MRRGGEARRRANVVAARPPRAISYAATCTAAARFSDAIRGIRGNGRGDRRIARARRWTARTSPCRTPARHRRPRVRAIASRAASRTGSTRPANARGRADSPIASAQPASASRSVATTCAPREHRRSRPVASASASGSRKVRRRDQHEARQAHGVASRARQRRCCPDAWCAPARRGCARANALELGTLEMRELQGSR